MKVASKISVLAAVTALLGSAPAIANGQPAGICPEKGTHSLSLLDIANLEENPEATVGASANVLMRFDANGDGYACGVLTCTLCPVNAPFCHQVCIVRGPFADNDVDE